MTYQRILRRLAVAFLIALLLLTLLSQTLADLRAPAVTLAFAEQREMTPLAYAEGVIEPARTEWLYAPADGAVSQLAEVNATVALRGLCFAVVGDPETLAEELAREQDQGQRLALNIAQTERDRAFQREMLAGLPGETPVSDALLEFDLQLAENERAVQSLEAERAVRQMMLDEGAVAEQSVAEVEDALDALRSEQTQIAARRAQAEEEVRVAQTEQERALQTQRRQYEHEIARLDTQLQLYALDRRQTDARIQALTERVESAGAAEVAAASRCTVLEYAPGVISGTEVREGAPVMRVALLDGAYVLQARLDANAAAFVAVRDMADVVIGDLELRLSVHRLLARDGNAFAEFRFEEGPELAGKRAQVTVEGDTFGGVGQIVVPAAALREDGENFYLLFIESEKRLMGYDHYTRAIRVLEPTAKDDRFVMVMVVDQEELTERLPIVVNSDRPVYEHDRVRLAGEYDIPYAR